MIFEIISGGEKTDWVGKEWAGLFFPRGKNGPAHSFPGEKTDWGEIPACYTGFQIGETYSNFGRTRLAKALSFTFGGQYFKFLLKNPRVDDDFFVILSI